MDKYTIKMLFWAEQDLNEIGIYSENISKGLGDKFYKEVRSIVESLKINPFYQLDSDGLRKIPVEKFPYKVFFKVNENEKIVFIEAIISDFLLPFSSKPKQ